MNDLAKVLPILFQGLGMTLLLLAGSLGIGFVLGIPIGVLNVFGPMPARVALKGFDLVMRGFPAIVLLFLVYFGLGNLEGIHLTSLQAAILALGLRSAAYQGQLVRGAIGMVDRGQLDAASALGMPLGGAIRHIVFPQAIRFALPSLANEYSIVLKDTSLAFTVGVLEMMSRAKFLAASTRQIALVYVAVAIMYWALTQIGLLGFHVLERGARIPGVGDGQRTVDVNEWITLVPRLLDGWAMTLRLLSVSIPLGLAVGIVVGVARVYGPWPMRLAAAAYQSLLRGVPLVVQLFVLYYVLPRVGLLLSPFAAATLGFGLCSGAYHSEYIRSAIGSIPRGQMEAARALGMSRALAIRTIILPQTARRALPGCGNELVYLVKYSSLAYLVTLVDLTGAGRIEANASFRFFETFLVVGLLYLLMVALVRTALHLLRRHWKRSTAGVFG